MTAFDCYHIQYCIHENFVTCTSVFVTRQYDHHFPTICTLNAISLWWFKKRKCVHASLSFAKQCVRKSPPGSKMAAVGHKLQAICLHIWAVKHMSGNKQVCCRKFSPCAMHEAMEINVVLLQGSSPPTISCLICNAKRYRVYSSRTWPGSGGKNFTTNLRTVLLISETRQVVQVEKIFFVIKTNDALGQRGPTRFDLRAILQKTEILRATSNTLICKTTYSQDLKLKREDKWARH